MARVPIGRSVGSPFRSILTGEKNLMKINDMLIVNLVRYLSSAPEDVVEETPPRGLIY